MAPGAQEALNYVAVTFGAEKGLNWVKDQEMSGLSVMCSLPDPNHSDEALMKLCPPEASGVSLRGDVILDSRSLCSGLQNRAGQASDISFCLALPGIVVQWA
jgi:hypothetical protein